MEEDRKCRKCGDSKPYIEKYFRTNKRVCRDCDREASRKRTFKVLRGISHEERDRLLEEQGNVCKCCGTDRSNSKKGWHVDHCHKSGEIRGVLCANCNIALGMVDDSVGHLHSLVDYLLEHRKERATTIPKGSTPQAIGGGSGEPSGPHWLAALMAPKLLEKLTKGLK